MQVVDASLNTNQQRGRSCCWIWFMRVDASFNYQTMIGKETWATPQLNYMGLLFSVTYCDVVTMWQVRWFDHTWCYLYGILCFANCLVHLVSLCSHSGFAIIVMDGSNICFAHCQCQHMQLLTIPRISPSTPVSTTKESYDAMSPNIISARYVWWGRLTKSICPHKE